MGKEGLAVILSPGALEQLNQAVEMLQVPILTAFSLMGHWFLADQTITAIALGQLRCIFPVLVISVEAMIVASASSQPPEKLVIAAGAGLIAGLISATISSARFHHQEKE